jgi:hypothetical protein
MTISYLKIAHNVRFLQFFAPFDQFFAVFDHFISEKKPNSVMIDLESSSSQNKDDKKVYQKKLIIFFPF